MVFCTPPPSVVKLDVRAKAAANYDYMVTLDDLREWEKKHGDIPQGRLPPLGAAPGLSYSFVICYFRLLYKASLQKAAVSIPSMIYYNSPGCIVLMQSGWDSYLGTSKYYGSNETIGSSSFNLSTW